MQLLPMQLLPFTPLPDLAISINVTLKAVSDGFLLEHCLVGTDVDALQLDAPATEPCRRDELSKNTCFEVFFGVRDSSQYYEFNGSPSGDWALYKFEDYRQGMTSPALSQPPSLCVRELQPGQLRVVWHIPFLALEGLDINSPMDVSITAVIKCKNAEAISYWALRHVGPKPDFHLRESFVLFLNSNC